MTLPFILTFDIDYFRQAFPEFGNTTAFPNAVLERWWDWATLYISKINCGYLHGRSRKHALDLMTAHLGQIEVLGANGDVPGMVTKAKVDKVEVDLEAPPLPNQWQFWLGTTRYGQALLALLQVKSVGGFYTGGQPVLPAFNY